MTIQVERHIRSCVDEALKDARIVVVQGARQVGKSTLAREVATSRAGRYVTLDDDVARAAASVDPVGFVRQAPGQLLVIDEVQRVPDLVLALKLVVDETPRPGGFLLTGSADLLRLPAAEDSLAGRAESLELFGFSQGELIGRRETFIDRLFGGETFVGHVGDETRAGYLTRATSGAYPEALGRPEGRRRNRWLDNYLARIVERDAREVTTMRSVESLPLVLRVIASRNASELNLADLASDTRIPATSLARQVELLETLYLIQRVPAWSANLTKRAVSRPKMALLDTGLAARLMHISATGASPTVNPDTAGGLLEGFVLGELRRQLGWAEQEVRLFHFRDRAGDEVDVILESIDGRIAGLEVKASASVGPRAGRWLEKLRDRLGTRFTAGLILHTGQSSAPFGDRIAAVPIDVLWRA